MLPRSTSARRFCVSVRALCPAEFCAARRASLNSDGLGKTVGTRDIGTVGAMTATTKTPAGKQQKAPPPGRSIQGWPMRAGWQGLKNQIPAEPKGRGKWMATQRGSQGQEEGRKRAGFYLKRCYKLGHGAGQACPVW